MSNTIANRIAAAAERISSLLGPHMMRYIAHFNKPVTNPIQRLWAARLHHMAVIEHRGRSTGKDYRTPVMAFVVGGEFVVFLNYGTESDWVRNVQAAGIDIEGVTDPPPPAHSAAEDAAQSQPAATRFPRSVPLPPCKTRGHLDTFGRVGVHQFVRFTQVGV
jgi:deazaflavin-dependent oxidoreductase (nitroreductase family)